MTQAQKLVVEAKEQTPYDIVFTQSCASAIRSVIDRLEKQAKPWVVVADDTVTRLQKAFFQEAFGEDPLIATVKPTEASKSLKELESLYQFFSDAQLDRRSVVFALGGGVIGDLTGFAAATFLRGIRYYQVPTSLLAMVDSSIGGKTAINLGTAKNLIGAFYQPKGVYIDNVFLKTLPQRAFNAGMAEVIKYGLLGSRELFDTLCHEEVLTADSPHLSSIIYRCCRIKASIVQADALEQNRSGGRALLNLGHTFGHALEMATEFKPYLHGEAIAIGLVMAARLSKELGKIQREAVEATETLVARYGLPVKLKEKMPVSIIMNRMRYDKKFSHGRPRFVLLESLGNAYITSSVDESLIRQLWMSMGAA